MASATVAAPVETDTTDDGSHATLSRSTVGKLMGERPESDGADDSDRTFRGSIRKISLAGLVSIAPEHGDSVWYRPVDGTVAAMVRRIPVGDACIVRVRDDKLVHIAPRLDTLAPSPAPAKSTIPAPVRGGTVAPDPKPASTVKSRVKATPKPNAQPNGFYEKNERHMMQRADAQARNGGMKSPDYSEDRKCADCGVLVHARTVFHGGLCPPCQRRADRAPVPAPEKSAPATKRQGTGRKRQA